MAWIDNLLEASFAGVVFDCVSTTDETQHALVEHEYPYVDGADVEDMGLRAKRVNVRAIFYGSDYDVRLEAFIKLLDAQGGGELQHPVFGKIHVKVANYNVAHEAENVDEAHLDIVFVASTTSAPFFALQAATQKADAATQHGQTAISSASDKAAALIARIQASNPLNGLDRLRQTLTAPLLAITAQVGVVLSGLDPLAYPRAWAGDVSALAGGLLDARDWTLNVRAQWPSILSDFNAFSIFSSAPVSVTQVSSSVAPTEDQGIAAVAATVQVIVSAVIAEGAGVMLSTEITTPTLTPAEVEALANTTRTNIETAINQVRALYTLEDAGAIIDSLKNQALAIQSAAASVIAARPPLIQRTIVAPGNFRLQAHAWYQDSDRAVELYLMNGARSPFTTPGEVVNAYAS